MRPSRGMGSIDKRKKPKSVMASANKPKPLDKLSKRAKHADSMGKATPKQRSMFVDGGMVGSVPPKGHKRLIDGVKHAMKKRGTK